MLRRIFYAIGALLGLAVLFAGGGLLWAHIAIRGERSPLPARAALAPRPAETDLPIRLSVINTATQPMPRAAVLDPGRDPHPNEPYVMSHPSFVLEWPDGRILLIDTGMTPAGALEFGRPLEWLGGAQPIRAIGSVADQLGEARSRVRGVVFTHLHSDHVGGLVSLCEGRTAPLPVFLGEAQDERPNYTTRGGRKLIASLGCVAVEPLHGDGALAVPGFPGVRVVHAAGHTPGSQILTATVRGAGGEKRYVFAGDTVNALDGIRDNVPKPTLYRWLLVPEDEVRQDEMRRFVRDLSTDGYTPLVSHDQLELEKSAVPPWHAAAPGG